MLYLLGATFRCRRCYGLTYRSCQESDGRVSRLVAELRANPAQAERVLARFDSATSAHDVSRLILLMKAQERLYAREMRALNKAARL